MTNAVENYELGDVVLQSGLTLRGARLAYKTFGVLNANRDNVIVFPTFFGSNHTGNEPMIGEDMALDPSRYFVIVPNLFGNGMSSSPSNTPQPYDRARFPKMTYYDNITFQHRLVTENFGVERIGPPCAHGRILKIDDRLAKLLFGLARFRVALPMARLPFGHGPRSQKPSQARSCEQRHDCNDCHFHGCRLGGTHAEHQPFPTAIPDAMFASGPSIPKARPRDRFSRTKRCQRMYFINQPSKKATRYRESPLCRTPTPPRAASSAS